MSKHAFTGPARDYDTNQNYCVHRNITLDVSGDIDNYLISKFFGKNRSIPFVIYKNMFPYRNIKGRHLVCWINPRYEKFYNVQRVKTIVDHMFKKSSKRVVFENVIKDKSVFGVLHYQVLLD
jgi:hypothetical protein